MKKNILFVSLLLILIFPLTSFGYEVSTHAALTRQAYNGSVLQNTDLLTQLGVSSYNNDLGNVYLDMNSDDGSVTARLNNPVETGEKIGDKDFTKNKFDDAKNGLSGDEKKALTMQSPVGWMMVGAIREDDVVWSKSAIEGTRTPQDDPYGNINRVFGHFYDPYLNSPIIGGSKTPEWAIEGTDAFGNHRNHFSIADAKEAMFRAATLRTLANGQMEKVKPPAMGITGLNINNDQDLAKAYWATVFRSLGDASHLLQDMAQPQHTRVDFHAGVGCLGVYCFTGNTSFFEGYIEARAIGNSFFVLPEYINQGLPNPNPSNINGSVQVASVPLFFGKYPVPGFNGYYDYYRSQGTGNSSFSGMGLANYSNMNFYTAGTNVDPCEDQMSLPAYTRPPGCATNKQGRKGLMDDPNMKTEPIPVNLIRDISGGAIDITPTTQNAVLTLYRYPVQDNFSSGMSASTDSANSRATSLSIFNQFLADNEDGNQAFSLNYYNYDAQANVLLPASIAYTTGLINYFFHGKMEISLPAMGIYSIVDHGAFVPPPGTDAKNGFRGFDKIKLTLKNTTDPVNAPDGSHPQTMSNGYLVAVLKFHRNLAYTDDLDGELGMDDPASVFFDNYSWNEEIVASDPVRLTSLANGESAEFAFTFPTDGQMPINAVSTVRLSVVFKGILGSEQDAVVVAEKPISPPIYFSVYNASDYLRLGNTCYQNTDILANDALWAQLNARCKVGHALDSTCQASPMSGTLSFGPPGNQVLLTWDNSIPERRFARIAFLGDNDPSVLKGTATFTGGNTQIWNKTFDGNAGTMFWYRQIRGVKYNGANVQYLSGDASTSMGICNNFLNGDSDSALPIPAPLEGSERYPVPATSITGW